MRNKLVCSELLFPNINDDEMLPISGASRYVVVNGSQNGAIAIYLVVMLRDLNAPLNA